MRKQNTLSRILGLASLVGVVALGACGGGGGAKDMAVAVTHDMAAPGGTNCAGILDCSLECNPSTAACIAACINKGTTAAQNTFQAITGCGLNICTQATSSDGGDADGGNGAACSSVTDTSAACVTCATNAAQSAACASFIGACENS